MEILRIQRSESNFFRYRQIAGRFFIFEEDVMNGKIPCKKGKIVFYGEKEPQSVVLPTTVFEKLPIEKQEKVRDILSHPEDYPSLYAKGIETENNIRKFHEVARKFNLTNFVDVWYKDTLFHLIRNQITEGTVLLNDETFKTIGEIMYYYDVMILSMEDMSIIEDHILTS